MLKIGISLRNQNQLSEEFFDELNRNGVGAIEHSIICKNTDYKALSLLSRKYDVDLWSYHLPYNQTDISDPLYEKAALDTYRELINEAAAYGFSRFVIHPCHTVTEEDRAERFKIAKRNLPIIAEYAKSKGAVLAVEDLPKQCIGRTSGEILELISTHENLYACFDTNHLFFEKPHEYARALGDKIITMHVSDYDFISERHWLPGEGKIDWISLYNAICDINYKGVWMYEVSFSSKTIFRDKPSLDVSDFANNAREIFAGKQPTKIGTPNPEIYNNI